MTTWMPLENLDKEISEYIKKMDHHRSTTLNEEQQQERLVDILTVILNLILFTTNWVR